jgi:hypothetical protein
VGVPRVIGRKRTHEEKVLAAMPVSESFALLAQREPRLLTVADEALRVAESARGAGEDESSVRASISGLFARITAIDPIVGPKASGHSENPGLVVTETATQVVWTHLVSITDVPFLDLQEHPEHTERAQVATEIVDSIDIGDPRSKAEFRAELEEALTERGMTLPSHQLDGLAAGLELRSDPKRAAVKAVLKTLRGTKQCE